MLQPSVVARVSASRSAEAPIAAANRSRTRARSSRTLSNHGLPPRPSSWSKRFRSSIAAIVRRESGPSVPAFRYA